MSADGEGFLSRWSRRKAQARAGVVPPEPLDPSGPRTVAPAPVPAADHDAPPEARSAAAPVDSPAPAEPLPTLQNALRLTPQADFRPFMRPEVAPEVRNAALRRLFADPHFNQMDGLDVYIDDYSKPDPLPAALARRMVAAQFMRLFDEPREDVDRGAAGSAATGLSDVPASDPSPAAANDGPSVAAVAANTQAESWKAATAGPGAAAPVACEAEGAPRPEPSVAAASAPVMPPEPAR